jgi:hypothetical protein
MQTKSKTNLQDDEMVIAILSWLANEPEIMGRFLALSGCDISDLRRATSDPAVQLGILDFLMGHEPTLLSFATAAGIAPELIAGTWQRISGPGSAEFGW